MEDNNRDDSRRQSKKTDRIKITAAAMIFMICSVAIFATKYKKDVADWFTGSGTTGQVSEVQTESDAKPADEQEKNTEERTTGDEKTEEPVKPTTEEPTETTTEAPTTEAPTTEAPTTEKPTEEVPSTEESNVLDYINAENPDTSLKGDDWYNKKTFLPANVTDDKYFDTAVVIGDSRTEGLSLYTGMSNLDAFFSKGLNIEKVMTDAIVPTDDGMVTVLEALELKKYDNIYISFGINELGWVYEDVFIEDYKMFIDAIREIEPDATIYVENILPVSQELSDEDEIYNNPNIEKFNKLLKDMCKDYGDVIYLDVASSVIVDGALPAEASTDGRHCNKEYCEKWLDYIRKNVYIKK